MKNGIFYVISKRHKKLFAFKANHIEYFLIYTDDDLVKMISKEKKY